MLWLSLDKQRIPPCAHTSHHLGFFSHEACHGNDYVFSLNMRISTEMFNSKREKRNTAIVFHATVCVCQTFHMVMIHIDVTNKSCTSYKALALQPVLKSVFMLLCGLLFLSDPQKNLQQEFLNLWNSHSFHGLYSCWLMTLWPFAQGVYCFPLKLIIIVSQLGGNI